VRANFSHLAEGGCGKTRLQLGDQFIPGAFDNEQVIHDEGQGIINFVGNSSDHLPQGSHLFVLNELQLGLSLWGIAHGDIDRQPR